MPFSTLSIPQEFSEETEQVFGDFQRGMGFPMTPNFMKMHGHSAAATKGTWGLLQGTLLSGNLPRALKEMLIAAISHDRKCMYCEAAHLACCRSLGIDSETLQALVENVEHLAPEKVRDIILFAVKCARDPQGMTSEDYASLHRHGLNDEDVMELISVTGLAVYLNIVADATGVTPDDMFFSI
ncbi:carboxymuconolactone decarboxylase family protein [Variovorax sp. RHLX14]|uniref:carboxymuconolactone decarboxylase family protein n=1 Tax=Variovorax sp. RHLX14 TaxID=1259731 RepID=UPI003F447D24